MCFLIFDKEIEKVIAILILRFFERVPVAFEKSKKRVKMGKV